MMRFSLGIYIFFFLLSAVCGLGQNKTDSLEQLISKVDEDNKARIFNQLSRSFIRYSPEKAMEYAKQAYTYSQKFNDSYNQAFALENFGDIYYERRELDTAKTIYTRAMSVYEKEGEFIGISNIFNDFGVIYSARQKFDSAEYAFQKAISIKKDINDEIGLAEVYINYGIMFLRRVQQDKGLENLELAIRFAEKSGSKYYKARALSIQGDVYFRKGLFEKAVIKNYDALNIAEEINDPGIKSIVYNNLGNIYELFKDYSKSLDYYKSALKINQNLNNKIALSVLFNNIGNVYISENKLDSALIYYFESLDLKKQLQREHGIAITANNIGEVYNKKGELNKALEYLYMAQNINERYKFNTSLIRNKMIIGGIYLKQKKYKKAEDVLIESLTLSEDYNFKDKYYIYLSLSELYEETGRVKKSLQFHKRYSAAKDSILNLEKEEAVARINAAHQLERHKQEINILSKDKALQQQKLEKQKVIQNMFMLASVFVLAFAGFIYYHYRNKIRSNKILSLQNDQIRKKNQEIKHQAYRLSRANHELEKLSIVASKTDNAIIIAKPNGAIEWINDGFTRLYGYTYDEFIGTKGKTLEEASANPAIDKIIQKAITEKQSQIYESEIVSKTGERHKLQTTLNPIVDDDGQVIKLVTIDSDISKLKQVEKELQDLVVTKEKFFSIIAHDLKNPFNSLIGLSQLLVHGFDKMKTEKVKYFHQNLYQISKVGYDLLVNLLEWSKSQTGNIKYSPEDINISGVTEETFALYQSKAKQKEILLTNNLDEDSFVYADKNMVKTIFRNLISNALKFTGRGGVIEVSSYKTNSSREISIRDTGVGMKPEDMDKLFRLDTNYTTKGTEDEGGTGLGLVLVKEFIEKNKGFIHVESKPGIGSNFIFTLPAEK